MRANTQVAGDGLLFQGQQSHLFPPRHAGFWFCLHDSLSKGKVTGTQSGLRQWLCHAVLSNGSRDGEGQQRWWHGQDKGQAAGSPHQDAARPRGARTILADIYQHHTTLYQRERVSKGRGSPAGFSGSVSQEDAIAGPGGPDLGSLAVGRSPMGDTGLLILSFRHL